MKKQIILLLPLVVLFLNVLAQDGSRFLRSVPSSRGNYIYLYDDEQAVQNTAYFLIQRIPYDAFKNRDEKKLSKPVTVKPAATLNDLQRFLSKERISELQQLLRLPSADAVAAYFAAHPSPGNYPFVYNLIETRQALGHVWLDEAVEEGELYVYQVNRVTKTGATEDWGFAITQSKAGNYTLPYYKPRLSSLETSDSAVQLIWKMPVPEGLYQTIPVPPSVAADDTGRVFRRILLSPLSIRANVFLQDRNGFVQAAKLSPVVNATKDTVVFTYVKPCVPEEKLSAFLVTEDEVYNAGIASDTALAYAVAQKSVPLVYGIRTKDVLNGVRLSWDALPSKPYLTGIHIGRYNSSDVYDSVATLLPTDTSFIDYQLAVGQTYRYKVKALFLPQLNVEQAVPAEGVGTFTVFNRPLPPANLTVEDRAGNPFLKWDVSNDPSYYGSFVYRGTSPTDLSVVAGPIRNGEFLDTAKNITGRSEYYYAVLNQNLREDTSVYSNIVRIVPSKKINTTIPTAIDFYYVNGVLRISWNDVRAMDNAIEAFVVQRKTAAQKNFATITPTAVINNYTEDSSLQEGVLYEYRVAALSYKGDTTAYSLPHRYQVPAKAVGITVSWPPVLVAGRKGYTIYRREAGSKNFVKLSFVPGDVFSYTDKNITDGKVYVYRLAVVQEDGREGPQGTSLSLRRLMR